MHAPAPVRALLLVAPLVVACSSSVDRPGSRSGEDAGAEASGPHADSGSAPKDSGAAHDSGPPSTMDGSSPDAGADGDAAGLPPRGQNCAAYKKLSPAKGAHEYFVDVGTGSDANDGSSGAPFQTVQHAANVAIAGDVVTIRTGTYSEIVNIPNSGTPASPIVFQADSCGGAVFTGQTGFYPVVYGSLTVNNGGCAQSADGQHDITLSGLTFKDTHDSPSGGYSTVIALNDDWILTNLLIDGSDDLEINQRGTGDVIEQSTFMHGGSHSLVGCGGNPVVRNVTNANNVTSAAAAANCGDSCSVKFLFTDGMLVDNIESYGNNGPGFWFDTNNFHFVVKNSSFHDNAGAGVADEISDGPGLIEGNTFQNNGQDIGIWESKAVTIQDNVMNGGSGSPLQFRTMTNRCEVMSGSSCSKWYQIGNLDLHGNKIKNWTGCLINDPAYSSDPMWASPLFTSLNITMDYDDLWPSSTDNCFLSWQNEPSVTSIGQLQSTLGVEAHGSQTAF